MNRLTLLDPMMMTIMMLWIGHAMFEMPVVIPSRIEEVFE